MLHCIVHERKRERGGEEERKRDNSLLAIYAHLARNMTLIPCIYNEYEIDFT